MKKNYLIIIMMFLLSGCSVEYNLEFNDNILNENIKIGKISSEQESEIGYLTPYAIYNNIEQELYEFDYSQNYINLKYKYNTTAFEKSQPFNECYELSNISYDNDSYYILTSKEFKCLNYASYSSDTVKIKFTTNHKVIETNADYVENGTHIWLINESNAKNKPIKIQVEKEKNDTTTEKKGLSEKQRQIIFWVTFGIIIIAVILIVLRIKKKIEMQKI